MQTINLIIVEDEPAILKGITMLIQRIDLPLQITGAYLSGQEALDNLSRSLPDIVITDVQMPVMSGLELIDKIKETGYQAEYLILSGYAEFEYVQKALELSVHNYLLKSPRISELRESLSAICVKIYKTRYENCQNFFQNLVFSQYTKGEGFQPPKEEYRITLCLAGPYMETGFDALKLKTKEFSNENLLQWLAPERETFDASLWVLNGYYPNMKILVVLERKDALSSKRLYSALAERVKGFSLFTTAVSFPKCGDFSRFHDLVLYGMKVLKKTVLFGENQFVSVTKEPPIVLTDSLTDAERDLFSKALSAKRVDLALKQYQYLAEKWTDRSLSQAEFTSLTKHILAEIYNQSFSVEKASIESKILEKLWRITASANSLNDFIAQVSSLIGELYIECIPPSAENPVETVIELLWQEIQKNFTKDIDVNDFAREHGYHPVYLITQFSKIKHIPPTKLIIQLRIDLAKSLLKSTDLGLRDIAEAVGYVDVSYFSRAFKEKEGVSPSMFRKKGEG